MHGRIPSNDWGEQSLQKRCQRKNPGTNGDFFFWGHVLRNQQEMDLMDCSIRSFHFSCFSKLESPGKPVAVNFHPLENAENQPQPLSLPNKKWYTEFLGFSRRTHFFCFEWFFPFGPKQFSSLRRFVSGLATLATAPGGAPRGCEKTVRYGLEAEGTNHVVEPTGFSP